jgi:curved DNA-binding protein CbpA
MTGRPGHQIDFYAVLGISHDSSADAVKRAYRKLARLHHPDTNAGNPVAEQHFKKITQAYNVLSHPLHRARYDLTRGFPARAEHSPSSTPPESPSPSRTPPTSTAAGSDGLLAWSMAWWLPLWFPPRRST